MDESTDHWYSPRVTGTVTLRLGWDAHDLLLEVHQGRASDQSGARRLQTPISAGLATHRRTSSNRRHFFGSGCRLRDEMVGIVVRSSCVPPIETAKAEKTFYDPAMWD
jgi:hypothetical protein